MNERTKFLKIVLEPYFLEALFKGVAAGAEHSRLLCALSQKPIRTVIDIGANRGQFAMVARKCLPDARIVAFEPLKEPAAMFRRVFAADPLVVLHEIAIGPKEKVALIHVSRADDSSSLFPISELQNKLFPGTAEKETRAVVMKRLDEVLCRQDIQAPALLKIDVQGFEREVLNGCKNLLPCFSYVYVECSFTELYTGQALAYEVIELLHGFSFRLCGIYNMNYDRAGLAVQGDFLFQAHSPNVRARP